MYRHGHTRIPVRSIDRSIRGVSVPDRSGRPSATGSVASEYMRSLRPADSRKSNKLLIHHRTAGVETKCYLRARKGAGIWRALPIHQQRCEASWVTFYFISTTDVPTGLIVLLPHIQGLLRGLKITNRYSAAFLTEPTDPS